MLVLFGLNADQFFNATFRRPPSSNTGTLEKLIVSEGSVSMDLNLDRLNGLAGNKTTTLNFAAERNSFFTIMVYNGELRGPIPSSMRLISGSGSDAPGKLGLSYRDLVVESRPWGGDHELAICDAKSGFVFFNVAGQSYDYASTSRTFGVQNGRLLISKEYAKELGRPKDEGAIAGQISITALMRPIEVTEIADGEVKSDVLPAMASPENGSVPGPDVVVGDLSGLAQFGALSPDGTQVGLAVGTDSCNFGTVDLHWIANPVNDHPVIPQNLYRMSGGAANDERFEQIGQSNAKHAFQALTENICGLGCNGVGGSNLGSGCSDPYSAALNSGQGISGCSNCLGSRAWINPFTGAFPRNDVADSNQRNNNHTGHTHTGPSHRILTEISDLSTSSNLGATYYAEGQYVTPHEYVWCQANPTQCNMNNNVSYRRYNVAGTTSPFTFSAAAATVRQKSAINAWTGATLVDFRPDNVNDGIGTIGYKVTNPSAGVWHYEYAVYNQNLDRGIQSFSVPLPDGITPSNIGFHAPPQHPGWTADGTVGDAGYSSLAWAQTLSNGALTWNSETFAQNPNSNAIRWGTLYNFRFDSNRPPRTVNATLGFFKTGSPITVQVQAPSALSATVSGRVTTSGWRGVGYAKVVITDGNVTQTVYTNSFGFFTFSNLPTGANYTVSVSKKRYTFSPQQMALNDNIANVTFINGQ